MIPTLTLEDLNGGVYNFNPTFWIGPGNISNNTNIVNKFYAAGGANVADAYLNATNLSLEGSIQGDTPAEFEAKKKDLADACLKGGKLRYSDDTIDRYKDILFAGISYQQEQGRLFQEYTIDFIVQFPFWQDSIETEQTEILSGNASFDVDNSGSNFIIMPTIEITATDSGGLPGVTMRNISDGAGAFSYSDIQFQLGDILIINSTEGTVKLNNGDRISNYNPAVFLRLQPTINTIEYEGGPCSITIKYKKVYLL